MSGVEGGVEEKRPGAAGGGKIIRSSRSQNGPGLYPKTLDQALKLRAESGRRVRRLEVKVKGSSWW